MTYSSVSIVIPAHNERQFLPQTIRQLQSSVESLNFESEIIVVDDASTDETATLASDLGCEVLSVELRNIGAVRNAGAARAKNDWLIFVDADTLVPPETLKQTLDALADGCIGGGAKVGISEDEALPWHKYAVYFFATLVWQSFGRWAAGCYVYARREAFVEIGGFPEEYFAGEEYFVSRRLKALGTFRIVTAPVITSARKLHDYSLWQILRFIIRPVFSRKGFLKSRTGLELLYQHKR